MSDSPIANLLSADFKAKIPDVASLAMSISQEEHQEIMAKMTRLTHLPAGHLDKTDELYLEQQLTDLLGFTVAAELAEHRLNHSVGVMAARPHLMRTPTDTLISHAQYLEAGISPNRSAFGWFTDTGELTAKGIMREKYAFSAQLFYLPTWQQDFAVLKQWYQYRKMIVINPGEEKAVVGVIADIGPAMWMQHQFGGSPEVIREGMIWSPKTQGHVFLFFVDDPDDTIPLGPVDMRWQQKEVIV